MCFEFELRLLGWEASGWPNEIGGMQSQAIVLKSTTWQQIVQAEAASNN